jgi:hypothetical protein
LITGAGSRPDTIVATVDVGHIDANYGRLLENAERRLTGADRDRYKAALGGFEPPT